MGGGDGGGWGGGSIRLSVDDPREVQPVHSRGWARAMLSVEELLHRIIMEIDGECDFEVVDGSNILVPSGTRSPTRGVGLRIIVMNEHTATWLAKSTEADRTRLSQWVAVGGRSGARRVLLVALGARECPLSGPIEKRCLRRKRVRPQPSKCAIASPTEGTGPYDHCHCGYDDEVSMLIANRLHAAPTGWSRWTGQGPATGRRVVRLTTDDNQLRIKYARDDPPLARQLVAPLAMLTLWRRTQAPGPPMWQELVMGSGDQPDLPFPALVLSACRGVQSRVCSRFVAWARKGVDARPAVAPGGKPRAHPSPTIAQQRAPKVPPVPDGAAPRLDRAGPLPPKKRKRADNVDPPWKAGDAHAGVAPIHAWVRCLGALSNGNRGPRGPNGDARPPA